MRTVGNPIYAILWFLLLVSIQGMMWMMQGITAMMLSLVMLFMFTDNRGLEKERPRWLNDCLWITLVFFVVRLIMSLDS